MRIHPIKLQELTAPSFSSYGIYASTVELDAPDWVTSGDRISGVTEETRGEGSQVSKLWKLGDLAFDGGPYMGYVRYQFQGFRVAQLERHRGETQVWQAIAGASAIVLALGDIDTAAPQADSSAAFLVCPGDLIAIHRGVWHCHFLPLGVSADFAVITARREPEQDRDLVDLSTETGSLLEICL